MKTDGFYTDVAKFNKIQSTETLFHGGKKYAIQTPQKIAFKLDSTEHKNIWVTMSRSEAILLAKAIMKSTKIKRTLRAKKRKAINPYKS